jgi:hypothetical protein
MPKWAVTHEDIATMSGEALLIAGVLRQLVADAQSPHATIRQAALTFLHDAEQLRVWTDLLGVEPQAFQARVAALLRPPREA